MGFRRPEKAAVLKYEGTDYEGAEVTVNLSLPLSLFFEIDGLHTEGKVQELLKYFVEKCVVEWNLEEDDGTATPVTLDGLLGWPPDFAMLTVQAWLEVVAPASNPLARANGRFEEADLDLGSFSRPG